MTISSRTPLLWANIANVEFFLNKKKASLALKRGGGRGEIVITFPCVIITPPLNKGVPVKPENFFSSVLG